MKHGTALDGNVIHHLSQNREVIATHSSRHHRTLIRNEVPEVGEENFKKSDLGNSAGISQEVDDPQPFTIQPDLNTLSHLIDQ